MSGKTDWFLHTDETGRQSWKV